MRIGILALALLLLAGTGFLRAGEATPTGRKNIQEVMELMRSAFSPERLEGIRRAARLTDKELVAEFKAVETLTGFAKDNMRFVVERSSALEALVQLALAKVIETETLLNDMSKIIRDKDDDLEIRMDTLRQLAVIGAAPVDDRDLKMVGLVKRLHGLVGEISEDANPTKTPLPLRAAALSALGSVSGNSVVGDAARGKSEELLVRALLNKSTAVRSGAMEGLLSYITHTGTGDGKLFTNLIQAGTGATALPVDVQLPWLQAVEAMLGNGAIPGAQREKNLLDFLFKRVREGGDAEMVYAVRCILRMNNPKMTGDVIDLFLSEVVKENRRSVSRRSLIMGLVELTNHLANSLGVRPAPTEQAAAGKQVGRITAFLATLLEEPKAFPELRLLAARGLGAVPRAFDRVQAVTSLAKILRAETERTKEAHNNVLIDEIEHSLVQYSRKTAFRTDDGAPDVEAWEAWLETAKAWLVPGKAPFMKDEEG